MLTEKRMDRNAKIIALFIMQYSLLIPVMQFINSTIAVGIFSVSLLVVFLFSNNLGLINWRIIFFYILLISLFVIKLLLGQATIISVGYVVLFTLPAVCLFLFPFRYSECINTLISLSRVSFFAIFWVPFFFDFNYMRFGYGMLPVVIMMYIDLVYKKRRKEDGEKDVFRMVDIGILLIGFAEMLMYGARGCLVAFILFIAMDRLLINKKHIFRNLFLIVLVLVIIFNIVPILDAVENIAEKIGVYSYSITKFKMQLSDGFESAASGRVNIYSQAIDNIKANPFFGGTIIMDEIGGDYAHNLFLQVGEDFGTIAIILLAVFVVCVLISIGGRKGTFDEKAILMLLFSTSIGRLLFSSTLWRRPEFWMLVCMMIILRRNRYYNDESSILALIDIYG